MFKNILKKGKLLFTKIHKSKTLSFGGALVLFGQAQNNIEIFRGVIPSDKWGMFVSTIGIAVIVLRTITTTSLEDK